MPELTPNPLSEEEAQDLLLKLRRREGSWVDWGQRCYVLQQAGYTPEQIFEETGIEASYQNLMKVAGQVYESLVKEQASEALLSYCQGPRSDVLYEFRVLTQPQRLKAAELAMEKGLDVDEAHIVARAIQDFARYSSPPDGFSPNPGDAVAYQCWKRARAKKDLQERSRLIAQGLKFAQSLGARQQIEKLLSDFTVVPMQRAPLLPVYRLEAEDELPRIIPVAGTFPLSPDAIATVPALEAIEPFRVVQLPQPMSVVPIPGWQVILKALDPVAILWPSDRLPNLTLEKVEPVVVVIDRQQQTWEANNYWLVEQDNTLQVQWFSEPPTYKILGQVLLILRPKNILDEGNLLEPWQMDD
ncbi:hypothetical protein K4A83_16840 [Spirulina subsalsa FACHB-351]|uniref:RuBisCO accumulation factor 1 n=1 Tax=Spirulina subsalsa FACHB-351 TaxID=234711 RepID=A0ABT3L8V0_9CYAN|nr:RuBisCO accumulation factor 1 [Spirulina subsalsa]MCW6037928.1 hypothetical protein [Spirulina subsalsa FACHB-351]